MNILERYRPERLADIIGQPAVGRLVALAASPRPSCWLIESPGGTGKTASAFCLANELGCFDGVFETCHVTVAADLGVDEARYMLAGMTDRNGVPRCSPLRLRAPNGWHVWVVEEMELVSPQCQRWLKDGLERRLRDLKAIVVATSNNVGKLDRALLQRFERLTYSAGPHFAAACQERLVEIWTAETGEEVPPFGWRGWGFVLGDSGLEFSMREALKCVGAALESRVLQESEVAA